MESFRLIINDRKFIVPEHQRGFSWTVDNFNELVDDITLAGLLNKNHYTGPIVVDRADLDIYPDIRSDAGDNINCYYLQDGQQRLTTLLMCCHLIWNRLHISTDANSRDLARDCERCYSYVLMGQKEIRLENTQQSFNLKLQELLLGRAPPAGIVIALTTPISRMSEMYTSIEQHLNNLTEGEVYIFGQYVKNRLKFMWVDLSDENVDKNLTFDTINSRGRPLSQFDKVKNFCVLVDAIRGTATNPEIEWFKSISKLETFNVSNDEDRFICDLFMIFHSSRTGIKVLDTHANIVAHYKPLLSGPNPVLETQLSGFINSWESYANSFGFITTKPSDRIPFMTGRNALCNPDSKVNLINIDRIQYPDIVRIILTCTHLRYTHAEFASSSKYLEIYIFRMYGIMGHRKDTHKSYLRSMGAEIFHNHVVKNVDWLLRGICWLLNRPGEKNAPLFKVALRLGNGGPKYGRGGWDRLYYFLYALEMQGGAGYAYASSNIIKRQSIEHIMPQSRPLHWVVEWPVEWKWEKAVHRLGNLVLTGGLANNNILGVKSIGDKISAPMTAYDYTRGTNAEKSIHLYAGPGPPNAWVWNISSIREREIAMITFALGRWKLPCCDDGGSFPLPEEFDIIEEDREPETRVIEIIADEHCLESSDPHAEEE